jgi:transposase InsO family protein
MTAAEIAEALRMALSTVSAVLKRIGLGKRSRLSPPEPANRYERKRPGELVRLDTKKLGRIAGAGHRVTGRRAFHERCGKLRTGALGWEFVHVAVDDATRLAFVEVLADERGVTAAGFLSRAVSWFASLGITVERVLSDNGACYRSEVHALTLQELRIRHLFTRPYRPRTNGKAERFIQRSLTSGPMALSTAAQPSAPQHSRAGSATTTTADHTARSATSHPGHVYTN